MKKHTKTKKITKNWQEASKNKKKYLEILISIDSELKAQSENTLEKMGMDMTTALRILLCRIVAEQRFPFLIQVVNTDEVQLNRQ